MVSPESDSSVLAEITAFVVGEYGMVVNPLDELCVSLDSLAMHELLRHVESRYGDEVTANLSVADVRTPQSLADAVGRRRELAE